MTVLLGRTSAGTTADFFGAGNQAGWKFTAVASGELKVLVMDPGAVSAGLTGVELAVFSDAGGSDPVNLLGKANVIGLHASGGRMVAILSSTVTITSGTAYWLAAQGDSAQFNFIGDAAGSYRERAGTGGTFTTPWSSSIGTSTVNAVIWGEDEVNRPDAVVVFPERISGVQPSSGAAAWTAGSYVELLPTGWHSDFALAQLDFRPPAAPAITTTYEVLFELATGAAGSEVVFAQLPWTFRNASAVGYLQESPVSIYLPELRTIAQDTRVSVRVSDSHTSALAYSGVAIRGRELAPAAGGSQALAGTSAGTSTSTGDLTVSHPLAGTSAGTSTSTGNLTVARPLAGTSAGTSTSTGNATVAHPLAGTSAGTSTSTGDLTVAHSLAGTSAGTATSTGDVAVTHPLAGTSAGGSTSTGDLTVAHSLAGISVGSSTSTGDLSLAGQQALAGTSAGASASTGDLRVSHSLAGTSAGTSASTGDLTVTVPVAPANGLARVWDAAQAHVSLTDGCAARVVVWDGQAGRASVWDEQAGRVTTGDEAAGRVLVLEAP